MSFNINLTDNPFLLARHLSQAQNGAHYYAPSKTTVSLLCRVPAALLSNNSASAALNNALNKKDVKKIDEDYFPKESAEPKVKKSSEYKIEEVLETSIDKNSVSAKPDTSEASHHKDLKIDLHENHFGAKTPDETTVLAKSDTSKTSHQKDFKINLHEDHFGVITSADFYEVEISENEKY
jgi:hypothetical protein